MSINILFSKKNPTKYSWQSIGIIFSMMLFLTSCSSLPEKVTHKCEDFLATWKEKTVKLKFTGCDKNNRASVNELVASYVVKGSDAAEVEKLLQEKFGMAPLKFLCCGWEPIFVENNQNYPGYGSYTDQQGFDFRITMISQETLLNDRQDWKNIPDFYIYVTKYLDAP